MSNCLSFFLTCFIISNELWKFILVNTHNTIAVFFINNVPSRRSLEYKAQAKYPGNVPKNRKRSKVLNFLSRNFSALLHIVRVPNPEGVNNIIME